MAARLRVAKNRTIALPEDAIRRLRIEPGSHVIQNVRNGYLVFLPEPADYAERLRGLHREVWEGVDPGDYVRQEREG